MILSILPLVVVLADTDVGTSLELDERRHVEESLGASTAESGLDGEAQDSSKFHEIDSTGLRDESNNDDKALEESKMTSIDVEPEELPRPEVHENREDQGMTGSMSGRVTDM